jgi:hypothetical protein
MSGYISQLILGFGIGADGVGGNGASGVGTAGKLDFSHPANGGLIAALRRF